METHLNYYRRWGRLAKPYFEWQFQQLAPYLGNRVADVGCGLGNFVGLLKNKELYFGLEPDEELAAEFRANQSSGNIQIASNGDITGEPIVQELRDHRIDSVICVNVLEHIKDDKTAMAHLVNGVTKGGHICILVPALACLYGTIDRFDGHHRRYSKKSLLALTNGLAVKVVDLYYMNFIGMFGWFIKGRILKSESCRDGDYKAMNRILPIMARLEKWIRPPAGMSLVMILRKE